MRAPTGYQVASQYCFKRGPKSVQDGTILRKRQPEYGGLKEKPTAAPRGFQEGLKNNAQGANEKPQDGPRRPEEVAQEGSKRPSEGPKEPQDGPARVQNDVPRRH